MDLTIIIECFSGMMNNTIGNNREMVEMLHRYLPLLFPREIKYLDIILVDQLHNTICGFNTNKTQEDNNSDLDGLYRCIFKESGEKMQKYYWTFKCL